MGSKILCVTLALYALTYSCTQVHSIDMSESAVDKPFLMAVSDVFFITGRGTVAAGRIEQGTVKAGQQLEIVGLGPTKTTTVSTVEMYLKLLDEGKAGDNVGLLLRGVENYELKRGQVLAAPGSIEPHTEFEASLYLLTEGDGGGRTPISSGHRTQFYFRVVDVSGTIQLQDEMLMPGETKTITANLVSPIAMNVGLRFAVRENGRTIGSGTVTKIIK